jgi:adenine specific DNA methylase Mod
LTTKNRPGAPESEFLKGSEKIEKYSSKHSTFHYLGFSGTFEYFSKLRYISASTVVTEYETNYGWTLLITLYNFGSDDKTACQVKFE